MAFALWIEEETAWAQGLHEYRPMGVAVVAATDRFRPRDFSPLRPCPLRDRPSYVGLFASLDDMNGWLERNARSQSGRKNLQFRQTFIPPWL